MAPNHTNRWPRISGCIEPRSRSGLGRLQLLAAMGLALLSPASSTLARAQEYPSVEYQVKAAFLYNFAKFVEWPASPSPTEKSSICICVFKHDPFGDALDEAVRGKLIEGRALVARRVNELPDLKSCQLVFVDEREDKRLAEILTNLKGTSVLVIGESDQFAERGGAIQFFFQDKKLRFSVNVDAIQRSGLKVSSKLLALARIVHDDDHAKPR